MLKKILSSSIVQEIMARLIAAYMILVRRTTRWEIEGLENAQKIWDSNQGLVLCYWHSRLLISHSFWPLDVQKILMLISLSRDGQFVARATELIGRGVIRGSSTKTRGDVSKDKGALQAVRALITFAKEGGAAAITPDGPKGPRMRVQAGSIRIAKTAGVPMLPISISIKGAKYLKTWDRLLVPPLFSRGVIIYGTPVVINGNDESAYEKARLELENAMIEGTWRADELCNGPKIEPADPVKSK